jgi:hypothetical protein
MDLIEESARVFKTPTDPKTLIKRPKDGDPLISPEKQKQFRMGVGMLIYLDKHACPDISNSVRELTMVTDGATEGHFKVFLRTIKHVLGTEDHGLLLQPKYNNGFFLEGISDKKIRRRSGHTNQCLWIFPILLWCTYTM